MYKVCKHTNPEIFINAGIYGSSAVLKDLRLMVEASFILISIDYKFHVLFRLEIGRRMRRKKHTKIKCVNK